MNINEITQDKTHCDRALMRVVWSLVHLEQPEVVVEIGTGPGNSTKAIALALSEIKLGLNSRDGDHDSHYLGHLWSVDCSDQVAEVFKEIEKLKLDEFVTRVKAYSEEAAKKFEKLVDILLIDGDHYYSSVRKDWFCWYPLLHQGSIVVFHDVNIGEVDKAYRELSLGYESLVLGDKRRQSKIGVVRL